MFPDLCNEGVKPRPHYGRCHPVGGTIPKGGAVLWVPTLEWMRKETDEGESTSALLPVCFLAVYITDQRLMLLLPWWLARCPNVSHAARHPQTVNQDKAFLPSFLKSLLSITLSQQPEMFFTKNPFSGCEDKIKTRLIAPKITQAVTDGTRLCIHITWLNALALAILNYTASRDTHILAINLGNIKISLDKWIFNG